MTIVGDVSVGLSNEGYDPLVYSSRGERLEVILTTICTALGEAGDITENKADIEFLISIVGTYLIAKKKGTLADDAKLPAELFNTNLFPMLDNYTLEEEEIIDVSTEE